MQQRPEEAVAPKAAAAAGPGLGFWAAARRRLAPDDPFFAAGDLERELLAKHYGVGHHIVGDLVALLDALRLHQVFVVEHNWGAIVSWNLCLLRPDRMRALVNLSVAFMPRRPGVKPVEYLRRAYGDDYYVCRFQVVLNTG